MATDLARLSCWLAIFPVMPNAKMMSDGFPVAEKLEHYKKKEVNQNKASAVPIVTIIMSLIHHSRGRR